jgi:putative acetyltransferase
MMFFVTVTTDEEYAAAAGLFKEYAAWLNIDLGFQHFEKELNELKSMYALPDGGIILCKNENEFIGCVGVRRIDDTTAELKRMYIKDAYQNKGLGKTLLDAALAMAKKCGYESIRLDTLNTMISAMNFYKKNGFIETPPYYNNPIDTAVYFQKFL